MSTASTRTRLPGSRRIASPITAEAHRLLQAASAWAALIATSCSWYDTDRPLPDAEWNGAAEESLVTVLESAADSFILIANKLAKLADDAAEDCRTHNEQITLRRHEATLARLHEEP